MSSTRSFPAALAESETGLHRACWSALSRLTGLGAPPLSYLPGGQPVPFGHSLLTCPVCTDRWVIDPALGAQWLPLLRRALLAAALVGPDAA